MSYTGAHIFWAGFAGLLLGLACRAQADVSIVRYTKPSYKSTYDATYQATMDAHRDIQSRADRPATMEF